MGICQIRVRRFLWWWQCREETSGTSSTPEQYRNTNIPTHRERSNTDIPHKFLFCFCHHVIFVDGIISHRIFLLFVPWHFPDKSRVPVLYLVLNLILRLSHSLGTGRINWKQTGSTASQKKLLASLFLNKDDRSCRIQIGTNIRRWLQLEKIWTKRSER